MKNFQSKEAIIARLERELTQKEYELKLATPYQNNAINPYYYSSAKYNFDLAKRDLNTIKN
jgi:hypothetical protein